MDLSKMGDLGDLAKQMQDAYSGGLDAMNQAGEEAVKDMDPDHEIVIDIELSAKIDGREYKVDGEISFEIELEPILLAEEGPMGDLSGMLEGLGVSLGDDEDAVMEQLGQPRAVGAVSSITLRELKLYNNDGKINTSLNDKATMLATLKEGKILINCEGVFTYPAHTDVFFVVPSMEKMQENIVFDIKDMKNKIEFNWTDKDNLKVKGHAKINKLNK